MPMTCAQYQVRKTAPNDAPPFDTLKKAAINADNAHASTVDPVAVEASVSSRAESVMSGTRRRIAPATQTISSTFASELPIDMTEQIAMHQPRREFPDPSRRDPPRPLPRRLEQQHADDDAVGDPRRRHAAGDAREVDRDPREDRRRDRQQQQTARNPGPPFDARSCTHHGRTA